MPLLHHYNEFKGISPGEMIAFEFLILHTAVRRSPYLSIASDSVMTKNLKQDRWNFLHLGNTKSLQETFCMLK